MSHFIIVGGGECAARAALTLREKGFDGRITLIGNEPHLPYERPPLSKGVLLEGASPTFVAEAPRYAQENIDMLLGETVTEIDRASKTIHFKTGRTLNYDKLLLATGARARALPDLPFSDKILALRSHDDAMRIRAKLQEGAHIAILGGGFIGLELASIARQLGAAVTLCESLPRLLSRGVPEEIANLLAARHVEAGVKLLFNSKITEINGEGEGVTLTLSEGEAIKADLLIVGIGAIPNTDLAGAAGLEIDNGIAVDAMLRTSDEAVFAAGDCASYPLPLYDNRRVRLESWRNAQEQGVLAATNMMGGQEMIASVPWFWSDQYELSLYHAGVADGATTSIRRDLGDGAFILFHLGEDGRLLAATGIGPGNKVARDIRLAEMLIAARKSPAPQSLAAADVKLKSLLAA